MFAPVAFFLLLVAPRLSLACAGGGIGGGSGDDNRIIQNPTFAMTFNPPVAWTYPDAMASATQAFFPGQSLSQSEANIKAEGDLEASALSAIVDAGLPTEGIKVRSAYSAQEISDCKKATGQMNPPGTRIGMVESGAVVRVLTIGMTALTPEMCAMKVYAAAGATAQPTMEEYIVQGTLQIEGLSLSKFQLRQIARSMMVALNFRYSARFTKEIEVQ